MFHCGGRAEGEETQDSLLKETQQGQDETLLVGHEEMQAWGISPGEAPMNMEQRILDRTKI